MCLKVSPKICTVRHCGNPVFDDKQKCILHCDKNDWYLIKDGKQIWDNEKVEKFWNELKRTSGPNFDWKLSNIIFPSFVIKTKGKKILAFHDVIKLDSFGKRISFINAKFLDTAYFHDTRFVENLSFQNCIFSKDIIFNNCHFQHELLFQKNKVWGFIDFSGSIFFKDIKMCHVNIKMSCHFNNTRFHSVAFLQEISCSESIIFRTVNFFSDFFLFKSDAENLILQDIKLSKNTICVLNDLKVDNFIIDKITMPPASFSITDSQICQHFAIKYAELTNFRFLNLDLSSSKLNIDFNNTLFANVSFSNVNWGKITERRINKDLFDNYPDKAREVYRQLKNSLDSQGDHIHANMFYSLEMKAHERALQNQKYSLTVIDDLIVFKLHKVVSNFGQSWIKPLIWILVVWLGYYLIVWAHQHNKFYGYLFKPLPSCIIKLISRISDLFNDMAKLIAPFLKAKNNIEGLEFVSLVVHILLAFLIYQFIVAVRRRVKR